MHPSYSEQEPPSRVDLSSQLDLILAELIGNNIKLDTIPGLNLLAKCSNNACSSNKEGVRHICIGVGGADSLQYRHLIAERKCPSCYQPIPLTGFRGVLFLECKAKVTICGEEQMFVADSSPVGHWLGIDGPDIEITVFDYEDPAISTGSISVTSKDNISRMDADGKSLTGACVGLNLQATCNNPACDSQTVVIRCRNIREVDYFSLIKGLACPGCDCEIPKLNFIGISLIKCQAEIRVGYKTHILKADGNDTADFQVDPQGPEVHIKLLNSEKFRFCNLPLMPQKGLTLMAKCSNPSCSSQSSPLLDGVILFSMGEVVDYRLQVVLHNMQCPQCFHTVPSNCFIATLVTDCTARVRDTEGSSCYIMGDHPEIFPLSLHKDPVIDILPVQVKQVPLEPRGSPYKRMKRGMNLKIICMNNACDSQGRDGGIVISSFPEMKKYTYLDILDSVCCPYCYTPLSKMFLLCLSFVGCRAEIFVGGERFVVEAGDEEALDFKPDSFAPEVTIDLMELDLNKSFTSSVSVPCNRRVGSTGKGGKFSHNSVCHGLNLLARCLNSSCDAVNNNNYVMIQSGHLIDCDLRPVMQCLFCPFCEALISPNQVESVTFLCCSGEITIGGTTNRFNPTGKNTSDFKITNDNLPVIVKVTHREYHTVENPTMGFLKNPFTKHHSGINYHCSCRNPACISANEINGLVIFQRDERFVLTHGYSPSVCNYSEEISQL